MTADTSIYSSKAARSVEAQILRYIDMPSPGYAVLLNGEWGSGKTFLWKHYLKERIANNKKQAIHISLAGVEDVHSITFDLLRAKYLGNKKNAQLLSQWGYALFDYVGASGAFAKLSRIALEDLKGSLVVVDDLERCADAFRAIMGVLIRLVEHYDCHMLILANEKNISDQDYSLIKEKLIGLQLEWSTPYELVLSVVDRAFPGAKETDSVIGRNRKWFREAAELFGVRNIRTIHKALAKIGPIVEGIEKRGVSSGELDTQLRFAFLAFCKGIENPDYLRVAAKISTSGVVHDGVDLGFAQFAAEFADHAASVKALPLEGNPVLGQYFLTGEFDIEQFNRMSSSTNRYPEHALFEAPEQELLAQYWNLPDAEFEKQLAATIDRLNKGQILQLAVVARLAARLLDFSARGLSALSAQDTVGLIMRSVDLVIEDEHLPDQDLDTELLSAPETESVRKEFDGLLKYIRHANSIAGERLQARFASDWLVMLENQFPEAVRLVQEETHRAARSAFVKDLDPERFGKIVDSLTNEQIIVLRNTLANRYRGRNASRFASETSKLLTLASQVLVQAARASEYSMRKYVLNVLAKTLSESVGRITADQAAERK